MKILYVIAGCSPCGGNRVIFEHCNRLIDKGHKVHVWGTFPDKDPSWFPLKAKFYKDHTTIDDDYDLVVYTYFETCYSSKLATKLKGLKKAYLVQGREPYFRQNNPEWKERAERTYSDPSVSLVTISKQLQTWLKNDYLRKSYYVPNGLDLDFFKPSEPMKKPKKPVILIEGSFEFWLKGIPDAIRALKELRKEGYEFEVWHLTGEKTWLDGVDKLIHKPKQKDIPRIYSTVDILLKPSYMEGSPLPHMEAMACGCLLVTSDCPGTEEYCKHDENCLKFETGDIENMKVALRWSLENDGKAIINNARKYALANYEWEPKIDKLEEIYEKIIKEG